MSKEIGVTFSLRDEFSSAVDGIKSKATGMKSTLDDTASSASNMGNAGQSGFGKIASGAASIAGAIGITKAFSAGLGLIKDGIAGATERIDTMDQYERVMGAMTGDSDAAAKSVENLGDIVDGTSMRLDVMAGSVQGFVTSGADIQKAESWVESWGNANAFYADGSAESFDTVTDALSTMYSSGKADMNQINRITSAGIPALDIFADKTGQSTDEVQAALSDGSISVEEFMDVMSTALDEGTEKFPEISTAMEDLGLSWQTVFGNIGEYAGLGMQKVIESIDDFLDSAGLPSMQEMLDSFGRSVEVAFGKMADWVPIVGELLVGMYEAVSPGLTWMKDEAFPVMASGLSTVWEGASKVFGFFSENWNMIGPIIMGVATAIGVLKTGMLVYQGAQTAVNVVVGVWNALMAVNPATWVAAAIGALVGVAIVLYKNWDIVREKTAALWEWFKKLGPIKRLIGRFEILRKGLAKVGDFFVGVKDKFIDFKDNLLSFEVPGWVSSIGGAIGSAARGAKNLVTGSFATGTDSVPHDMIAEIHKGEMIVPARQSEILRRQGVNIHNIHKGGLQQTTPTENTRTLAPAKGSYTEHNVTEEVSNNYNNTKRERTIVKNKETRQRQTSRGVGNITIAKLADEIVVREEADIKRIATALVKELKSTRLNMV